MVMYPSVTVSAVLTAPAQTLFDIVSDVTRHPELAGSREVQQVELVSSPPLRVGSHFRSWQRIGMMRYRTRSFVQIYEPPLKFSWLSGLGFRRPPFGQLWGFEFEPLGDGSSTLVMHSMAVPVPFLPIPPFMAIADRGARHEADNMRPTLTNLAHMAAARIVGEVRVVLAPCPSQQALLRQSRA